MSFKTSWAKDEKIEYRMINARSEGIEVIPFFSKPFHTQRCIVPSTGFYEWKVRGSRRDLNLH
jgi:putative SOS response-associated peptidase YedK